MIRIYPMAEVPPAEIFARSVPSVKVDEIVAAILRDVRERGDGALFAYTEKFDGAKLSSLAVPPEETNRAALLR